MIPTLCAVYCCPRATARYETGEAYAFAARAAVHAVKAVLAGARPGAWTPGEAFGPAFLASIAGGRIVDGEETSTVRNDGTHLLS